MSRLGDKVRSIPKRLWRIRPELLLLPQIPQPMHMVNPRTVLGNKWWNTVRQAAYESTDYHCNACGVPKSCAPFRKVLDAHEEYETDYVLGRLYFIRAVPLCKACHDYIHCGRLEMMLERGMITAQRYVAVIQHGDRILAGAKLVKPMPYDGPCAEWQDWRLVVEGKEYPPYFKSELEHEQYFLEQANAKTIVGDDIT